MLFDANVPVLNCDVYHLLSYFFVYSIMGWAVESLYMSACSRKWTNRGFIKGPICPIYGIGALSVYVILQPFRNNYILLYFCGAILATFFEFCVAHIMERFLGGVWWDYHDKPFNYKGIICLESTLAWGVYTVLMFGFLQKMNQLIVETATRRFGRSCIQALLILLSVYYVCSCICAVGRARDIDMGRIKNIRGNLRQKIHSHRKNR